MRNCDSGPCVQEHLVTSSMLKRSGTPPSNSSCRPGERICDSGNDAMFVSPTRLESAARYHITPPRDSAAHYGRETSKEIAYSTSVCRPLKSHRAELMRRL